jgi:hypothetical protein
MALLKTGGTRAMHWFSARFRFFQLVSERTSSVVLKLVALHLAALCFKCSHLFFKFVYALNQRKLRLLCGEDFFSWSSITAAFRMVASLMSLRAFAISKAVLRALAPAIASPITEISPKSNDSP